MQSVKTVACPRCGQDARFDAQNKWRPFCSERCRLIDMGNWAAEKYRVPEQSAPGDDDASNDEGAGQ